MKVQETASPKLTTIPVSTKAPTGKSKRVKKKEKGNDEDDSNNKQVSSDEENDQEKDGDDDKTQSNNENESDSEHETNESESGSKSDYDESEENEEDDDEDETKIYDKAEGDEDEEMDYITSQLHDDVDIRVNEPFDTDKRFVQEEGTDAAMTNVQQGNENPEIIQVIEDAHVTLSTILQKVEVPVTSSSHSSHLATKFFNFSDIPYSDAEIVSPMDIHVQHESLQSFTPPPQQSTSTPPPTTEATNPLSTLLDFAFVFQFNNRVTTLEKEVAELKKDNHLKTQMTDLVDEHLDASLGATRDEFINFLLASITARITEKVKNQLPQILPKEVSKFAPPDAATLTEFELKKILINKMDKSESYLAAPKHRECYEGLKKYYDLDKTFFSTYGDKSKSKSSRKSVQSEDPEFEVADSDMPHGQEENLNNDDEPKEKVTTKHDWFTKPSQPQEPTDPDWNVGKTPHQGKNQSWLMTPASFAEKPSKTFDELMSTPIDFFAFIMNSLDINNLTQETLLGPTKINWENPEGDDYPFDLTKPRPLVKIGNHQKVPVDYFFNNDLKYLKGGISTMTYTNLLTKTKAAQYDLLGIENMVPNIWSPVKLAYDKHALLGISHWREQRKTFYVYARGLQSKHDLYFMKRILTVTHVEVMRKHWYGYLQEIIVKRADNDLYRFKEGDFPRLCINDIEDMLLLFVQSRLINLSGDDISDFTIALRMFTRSLVTQKRVDDLQLRVKSYQKKINVTKPKTTKSKIKKRDLYTSYQDPQGFNYVNDSGRNRLMRSDELYKLSDSTLTMLRTSLGDIIKNIQMEYLPKRRWSTLEKKRANIMTKAINKQLKERRMMRSLEKFVGGREYETDLRLLQ
nr:hypothetical protein [Tanacetum cinerariifolium]